MTIRVLYIMITALYKSDKLDQIEL